MFAVFKRFLMRLRRFFKGALLLLRAFKCVVFLQVLWGVLRA